MPDVFPRRNLPGDAEQWGRAHDDRVLSLEASLEGVSQSLQAQNRNTASSLSVIADQVQKIADQQTLLIAQQTELANQQASILATTNFLATQTVSDSKSTLDQFSGSSSGVVWSGFDSTYDCSVTVSTGSAGKLLIMASATLLSSNLTSILAIEIVGVTGPSYPGQFSTYVSTLSAASSGVTRAVVANLVPNTSYTVRTRRGRDGSGTGAAMWRDQTLTVTRS